MQEKIDRARHAEATDPGVPVFDVGEIFPSDYRGGTEFQVPEYAFRPDGWTRTLIRGLSRFDGFRNKRVLEIGIGTGINAAYVLEEKRPAILYGSDVDGRCTTLAEQNILRNTSRADHFIPLAGDRNLADGLGPNTIDVVYGCLPQVVKSPDTDLHEGDNFAHYYDPALYPSALHDKGLGLNDYLLQQLHPLLPKDGTVILNLSGRPGREEVLEDQLFKRNGYTPQLLHEEVVAQHAGTSLATLEALEAHNGHRFEFFTSEDGNPASRISATEAERRRLAGEPLYHKIYVIAGRKK